MGQGERSPRGRRRPWPRAGTRTSALRSPERIALDLPPVHQVVRRHQLEQMCPGSRGRARCGSPPARAAAGVEAPPERAGSPPRSRGAAPARSSSGGLAVAEALRPRGPDRSPGWRAVLGQDHPPATAEDQLGVGQVLDHSMRPTTCPAPRAAGAARPATRGAVRSSQGTSSASTSSGSRVAEQVEQRPHVGGGGCRGARRRDWRRSSTAPGSEDHHRVAVGVEPVALRPRRGGRRPWRARGPRRRSPA